MLTGSEIKLIIHGCLDDDRACQRKLFDFTSAKVMSTCRRYCSNHEDARDLFQEAYIKIFKSLGNFNHTQGDLLGWVYIITKNCIFSSFSKKKLEIFPLDEISIENEMLIHVDHDVLHEEEVLREIQNLPDGYRVRLNMFVFDNMDHAAIASVLGISESTSRSQLTRARILLKKKLELLYTTRYEKSFI
ncbi:MAG: sigma-70 family RNA polymerase sigma factor [Saprospiraceae bacterium]|nr:sigma-70 family RNA polymerase sigma factor [Candidatus Vicinibacter affinis]